MICLVVILFGCFWRAFLARAFLRCGFLVVVFFVILSLVYFVCFEFFGRFFLVVFSSSTQDDSIPWAVFILIVFVFVFELCDFGFEVLNLEVEILFCTYCYLEISIFWADLGIRTWV